MLYSLVCSGILVYILVLDINFLCLNWAQRFTPNYAWLSLGTMRISATIEVTTMVAAASEL